MKATQNIYHLSPQSHQKKLGIPSLGGVGILVTAWCGAGLFHMSEKALWVLGVFSLFALIGLFDDVSAVIKGKNKGLTATQKFTVQVLVSVGALLVYTQWIDPLTTVQVAAFSFVLVGSSNASNLTDGLDGLLAGCSLITLAGFAWLYAASAQPDLLLVIAALMTAVGAFYWVNRHPASIFMGDTGSLALGASFAALAIGMNNVWVLLPLGLVYIVETGSVIIQVAYYKRTKKRIFLMAPLHHHFELMGMQEQWVVRLFWAIAALGAGAILL